MTEINDEGEGKGNGEKRTYLQIQKARPVPPVISMGDGPSQSVLFVSHTPFSTRTPSPIKHENSMLISLQPSNRAESLPRWDIASGQNILQPQLGGGESGVGSSM